MKDDFSYYLRKFLTSYLPCEKGFNTNTIDSYRYTFILLLDFYKLEGIKANKIKIADLTKTRIESFLTYLETKRENSVSTRNNRLAAIHSFIKYLQYEYPDYADEYINILTIPFKKVKQREMAYLTVEEMQKLMKQFNLDLPKEYRDYMLILLMYETAVRVSELTNITIGDFRFSKPYLLKVIGKGDKQRSIPLSDIFVERLLEYLNKTKLINEPLTTPLFTNSSNQKLTRAGVGYIINKYIDRAKNKYPNLYSDKVSPHTLRHTKAMHLLSDDVNLVYIRDILGHSSITTTEIYARADSARIRKAVEQAYRDFSSDVKPKWQNETILSWLKDFMK